MVDPFEQLKRERFSGKLVFVNPNTRSRGLMPSDPPFALMLLMGVCRYLRIPYGFIEADAQDLDDSQVVSAINAGKYDYVGVPLFSPNVKKMFGLLNRIKRETAARIIVGGAAPTADARWLLENCDAIDYAVIGEGEVTLPRLLSAIEKRREIESVPSIAYRSKGDVAVNPKETGYLDGDSIPAPDFDTIDFRQYVTGGFLPMGAWPSVHVYASRGCPFNCAFCANPVWLHTPNPVSTATAISWVQQLERKGVGEVVFADDTLNLNRAWFAELCERIISARLNEKMIFRGLIRANLTDLEQLKLARRAGFWVFTIGVESGAEEVLKYYKKHETLDQMAHAIEWCRSAGIQSLATFMAGAPIDTAQTLIETANFMREACPSYAPLYLLHPILGAPMTNDIIARGLMTKDEIRDYDNGHPTVRTETLNTDELIELVRFVMADYRRFRSSGAYRIKRTQELRSQRVPVERISKLLEYERKENEYSETDNGIPNVRLLDRDLTDMSWLPDQIALASREYRIKRDEWHEIEPELAMRWSRRAFAIPFYLKEKKRFLEVHWASLRGEEVRVRLQFDDAPPVDFVLDKASHDWRTDRIALSSAAKGGIWVKFEVLNSFCPPNDPREVGMAVKSMRFV
jgi:radical SAM superfamily enzyme YgiQ (UPF0313 family)